MFLKFKVTGLFLIPGHFSATILKTAEMNVPKELLNKTDTYGQRFQMLVKSEGSNGEFHVLCQEFPPIKHRHVPPLKVTSHRHHLVNEEPVSLLSQEPLLQLMGLFKKSRGHSDQNKSHFHVILTLFGFLVDK